ncbi:MAG: GWxTD domain-containing protein [Gemmatimonadetes bacterium]|nr:GWxTD domain-containing protein [Gemmatimonadota bacterium]
MKTGSVIYTGFILLFCIFGSGLSKGETTIDALFQNAMEQVGKVSRKESIVALEEIISKDKNYAPAYNELAKLHLLDHTVNGRQRAMRMVQRAIASDSDNAEYRLTRGKIWWAQSFRFRALNEFKNVMKKHPKNTDVLNSLGMFLVYDFLLQKDRRAPLKEMDMGSRIRYYRLMAMRPRIKDFKTFGQESKQEAVQVLRKSIELDETNQKPYYLLGILYFEDEDWNAFQTLMQDLYAQYPDDKNALLFCGFAAYQIGEFDESYEYYQRALDLMSAEERELLESIDLLVPQEDQASRDTTQAIDELLEREIFWKRQDPLYLSDFNERKMEHFGRIAYSNLRFRRFSDDVEGWQTDMGKTYIKFGRYRRRVTTNKGTWDSKEVLNATMMEFWYYENFQIKFCGTTDDIWYFYGGSWYGVSDRLPIGASVFREYDFGAKLPHLAMVREKYPQEALRQTFASLPRTPQETSHHILKKIEQRFVDPYLYRKYSLPYQVAAFEERDSVRVELSYMIPKDRLAENFETGKVSFWDGVFFFDQQWNDMYNDRESRAFALPPQKPAQNAAARHRNDHLLVSRQVSVPQGRYHFSVEFMDQTSGLIGVARDEKQYVYDDETFHLSDLLVGSDIQTKKALPESHDDLHITPNPVRTFSPSEPVFIYLELYDLQRDAFGRTQYEISYTIGKPEVDTLSPTLFASQDLIDTMGKTEIDLQSEEADQIAAEDLQTGQSQDDDVIDSVFPDSDIWGETKVYTSGGQVHHIAAEGLKIKRSKDGDLTRTVTANYEGNREDDFTYLQIDVNQVPTGIYQLTVLAKDKRTDQTDRKYVYFRIVE